MGRLADLVQSQSGLPLSAAAAGTGVAPLLLTRIDQGLQPMPARLAAALAAFIGTETWAVRAACTLNTDLDNGELYNPIPPRLGERVGAVLITPTLPVTVAQAPPPPSTDRHVIFFFGKKLAGAAVVEEYVMTQEGALGFVSQATSATTGYEEAVSGLFYPRNLTPTGLVSWDTVDKKGILSNPATFALSTSKTTASANYGPQVMAIDGAGFVWLASAADQAIYKLNAGNFSPVVATIDTSAIGAPQAIYYSAATGGLYALLTHAGAPGTTDWKLVRYDPSTATLSKNATAYNSPNTDMAATAIVEAASVPGALFTAGSAGKLVEWDEGGTLVPSAITLAGTAVPDRLRTVAYDAGQDYFWAASDTALVRMTTGGFVNFVDVIIPCDVAGMRGAVLPLVVGSLGLIVCPSAASNYSVRVYDAATAALRGQTGVGRGPNPLGTNNAPLSFALRP